MEFWIDNHFHQPTELNWIHSLHNNNNNNNNNNCKDNNKRSRTTRQDSHSYLITWDQANLAGDNKEICNENCDRAYTCVKLG
jgi:hypothetical protein